ncbi:hypothetical protein BS330_29315 [Amycolatopsis keratiniphila subsp. nogabecina]|nr:hypothetical protein BS330_29315 [Amycolatopsis keratiniphila subsp. nogabecina]
MDQVAELVASAQALFLEDDGRHDPLMDTGWPQRDGTPYYADLLQDKACLCLLARRSDDPPQWPDTGSPPQTRCIPAR